MTKYLACAALFMMLHQGTAQPVNKAMDHSDGNRMNVREMTSTRLAVFTIECWLRDSMRVEIAARDLPAAQGTDWNLVYNWDLQCIEFVTQENAAPDLYIYSASNVLTPYQWQHIAVVVNGPNGTIRAYVNGVQVLDRSMPPRSFNADVPLSWGSYVNGGVRGIGRMDECRYWNVERTQQQIRDAMNVPLAPGDRTGLVGYWRFCGNYADSSGNGNDGIPHGTTLVDAPELPNLACCLDPPVVAPVISFVGGRRPCGGDSVTLDAGAGYTAYRWSTGDTTRMIRIGRYGQVSVTVSDSVHCPATALIDIVPYPNPAPVIAGPAVLCRNRIFCLNAALPYASYRWSTGDTTRVICVRTPGEYTLTVTDSNGCRGTAKHIVVLQTDSLQISGKRSLCAPDTSVLTASDGYTDYRWSTGDSSRSIRVTVPGLYRVVALSPNGCMDTATVAIGSGAATPTITASRLLLCDNDSSTLTASAGYLRYRWSTGDTTRAAMVRVAGTYTVTVWDSLGCSGAAQIVITRASARVPTIAGPVFLCDGDAAILDAGAGYLRYRWSTGDTARTITVRQAGRYTVTVTDSNGCTAAAAHDITIGSSPHPVINGPHSICYGDTATLDAGGPYAGYTWSTGETTQRIRVTRSGLYTVTVTTPEGCKGSTTFEVSVGRGTLYIGGNPTLCGDSTVLTALPRFRSYRWSTGDTTLSITVRTPGTYSVMVKDSLGCNYLAELAVKAGTRLVPVIEGRTHLCDGDSLQLWISIACDSCRWSTGDTARRIWIRAPGVYSVVAWRSGYCPGGADTVAIGSGNKPTPSILGPARLCAGDTGAFTTRGVAGHTVVWKQTGGAFIGGNTGPVARVRWTAPGQWSVSVLEIDDSSGCADSTVFPVTVVVRPLASITALGPLTFCDGDSVVLDAGAGFDSYRWSEGSRTRRIVVRRSGTYTVTVENADGCSANSAAVTVTAVPLPSVRIVGPQSLCRDVVARYALVPPDSIDAHWTCIGGSLVGPDTAATADVRWQGTGTGYLTVLVTRSGCTATDTLAVTVGDSRLLPLTALPGTAMCEGSSVTIEAEAGYRSYTWTDSSGGVVGNTRSITMRQPGEYRVTATDSSGCPGIGTIRIALLAAPRPVISGPMSLCPGDTVTLDAGASWASVTWSTGDTGRTLRVAGAGTFRVTVRDSNGCSGVSPLFPVVMLPATPRPIVYRCANVLHCSPALTYQWYRNGVLLPGDTTDQLIISTEGHYTVRVTYSGGGCWSAQSIDYVADELIVELPVMEVSPGERVSIPITARTIHPLSYFGITAYRAAVRFNSGLLAPVEPTEPGWMDGDQHVIPLDCANPPKGNPIGTITCVAMLGTVTETPLTFDSFECIGVPMKVTRIDGKLTLRVCREGGTRLFEDSGRLALAQNSPNPFNASTRISFEIIEHGPTRLAVYDMLGRCVATILDGVMEAGRHSVEYDASALASAAYLLALHTPSATKVRIMLVEK